MRTVALVSGGKDSCYNMMQCVAAGHTIVALANLQPLHKDELDSYMYQTVGHQGIDLYAEAMGLPLYREVITGVAVDQGRNYKPVENDEVEDLYRLLSRVKDELSIEAVAVGAILSDYQRIRVENVCRRLGLVSLAYLWRRNQKELLKEMIASQVEAVVIKVAALGLDPRLHLGLSLSEIQPHLLLMHEKYGLNVCGEGGEYETFTTDCPLFRQRLVIDEKQLVIHSDDPVAPVGYLNLKLHLEPKPVAAITLPPSCKGANDFANDPNNTVFSDASDIELSETELESIEQIEHELKEKDKDLVIIEKECDNNSEGYTADEEIQEVVDHSSIYGNKHGWCFVGGVVGEGEDMAEGTNIALKKLINLLASKDLVLRDVCSVNLYMRDVAQYAALNTVYESHFSFDNPPPRVCVQVPLPGHVALILDAVAHKLPPSSPQETDGCSKERHTMHVQGISHWAPANIGPYSQAVKIGEVAVTSGQIGLVPGSMCLCEARAQALPLTHLGRVLRAVHPRLDMRSVMQSVCYTSDVGLLSEARRQLERRTAGALAQYAAVGALPKQAPLEWAAWAHTDNTRFHYEETGCNIGDYKVAITRRWNYENTVAAVVCCVATSSSPSSSQLFPSPAAYSSHRSLVAQMTPAHLQRVLEYAVNKLVNPQPDKDQPGTALNIRIFYQWESPLVLSAADVCARHSAALTLVPVRALHSAHTFLSISGLRLDE